MTLYDQKFGTPARTPKAPVIAAKQGTPPAPKVSVATAFQNRRTTLAYSALVAFSFLYFARPEDFIPGMSVIPVGKISGGLALAGLLLSWGRMKTKMPLAIKLVLVLLVHVCITVPFAFWRGGALDVVMNQFSKAVLVAVLVGMIVMHLWELRRLLWVQTSAVAVMTTVAVVTHPVGPEGGRRLWGLGGAFSNPNDFAINIAINFPLCLAFFLGAKGVLKKLIWGFAMLFLMYGVIGTYSRSGLIAMVICFVICIWEFGFKGKRPQVIVAGVLIFMIGAAVAVTTPRYVTRLKTLVEGDIQGSGDQGSLDARRELLMESIRVTFQHPIFGVGPGNFQAITKSWHVTHNTYTELSSETGLVGFGLFLAILVVTFRSLKKIAKAPAYNSNPQLRLLTNALRAGLIAYIVGAAFASTSYTLLPYFMVAYVAALYKIAMSPEVTQEAQPVGIPPNSRKTKGSYGEQEQHALAGAR